MLHADGLAFIAWIAKDTVYAGTWTLTLIPGAPDNNTYSVINANRPQPTLMANGMAQSTCWGNLSCVPCGVVGDPNGGTNGNGNGVDQYYQVRSLTESSQSPCLQQRAKRFTASTSPSVPGKCSISAADFDPLAGRAG